MFFCMPTKLHCAVEWGVLIFNFNNFKFLGVYEGLTKNYIKNIDKIPEGNVYLFFITEELYIGLSGRRR